MVKFLAHTQKTADSSSAPATMVAKKTTKTLGRSGLIHGFFFSVFSTTPRPNIQNPIRSQVMDMGYGACGNRPL